MTAVQDHETVSIDPFDQKQIDTLLSPAGACALNGTIKNGRPVGVVHSFAPHQGRAIVHDERFLTALRSHPTGASFA